MKGRRAGRGGGGWAGGPGGGGKREETETVPYRQSRALIAHGL